MFNSFSYFLYRFYVLNMFKISFKHYKSKCPSPDLSKVIDFNVLSGDEWSNIKEVIISNSTAKSHLFGLKPISQWKMYEMIDKPGLLFITNPFTTEGQRYWICRCLKDFPQKPHSRLNLDAHGDLAVGEDWWYVCQKYSDRGKVLLSKLRWATLGYHHNWDTKVYSEEAHDPFPCDLAVLCEYVAQTAGLKHFSAEAAIINYYHMDSTLSGHTDHSEVNQKAPLFSFSFGQSAIFLLGGPSIDDQPTAMFIHSGDIVIMSGVSRLSYHAVPRILPAKIRSWEKEPSVSDEHICVNNSMQDNDRTKRRKRSHDPVKCDEVFNGSIVDQCMSDEFWKPFGKYLETSRVNVNVRQVLYSEQKHLPNVT